MPTFGIVLMFTGATLFCLSLYGLTRRTHPMSNRTVHLIQLIHCIKIATRASRGIPDGDTIALREIMDLIKHFEDTH